MTADCCFKLFRRRPETEKALMELGLRGCNGREKPWVGGGGGGGGREAEPD